MIGIGNVIWDRDCFAPPPECAGWVDLASAAQIGEARWGQPRGVGVFKFSERPRDWQGMLLTSEDCRDAKVSGDMLDAWESETGYRPGGDTVADLLWDHLTVGADPANLDRCGMLVPTHEGFTELWMGDLIRRVVVPPSRKLLQRLSSDLEISREESHAGMFVSPATREVDYQYHRRIADATCEKYVGRNPLLKRQFFDAIRPRRWPKSESLLQHATTITDNFNRANAVPVSNSAEGWAWASVAGSCQIVSNYYTATLSGSSQEMVANSALSSSDNYSQCNLLAGGGSNAFCGPFCRKAAADTTRTFYIQDLTSTTNANIRKRIAGSGTVLRTDTTSRTYPDAMKIQANGSTISHYYKGVLLGSSTDTAITSGTYCGLGGGFGPASTDQLDDFQAGDLAAASVHPWWTYAVPQVVGHGVA